jgi:hypothetical protein
MNATDYLRARAKIDQDHRHKIKTLDDLWVILNDSEPLPQPIDDHDGAVLAIRGEWQQTTRQVLEEMQEGQEFRGRDVVDAMQKRNPLLTIDKAQVALFLKKAAERKEIDIVSAGAGKRATIFKKHIAIKNKKA